MTERLPTSAEHECVIQPRRGLVALDLKELWQYRELFWFLAWRDILVRYKQTYLGVAWAVLQPFLTMVVFTVIFGRLAKFPSNGMPYAVMTFAALLPWQFFVNALSESSTSLVASANMISKIYFPRLIIPASAVLSGTADFLISLIILFALMIGYGVKFQLHLLLLPLFFSAAFAAALATGLWCSALNVQYRDVRYVVPFLTRMGLYVSPVGFLSTIVPEKWRFWYDLNPMVGVIDGFRWAVFGEQARLHLPGVVSALVLIAVLLASGLWYFRKVERTFADVI